MSKDSKSKSKSKSNPKLKKLIIITANLLLWREPKMIIENPDKKRFVRDTKRRLPNKKKLLRKAKSIIKNINSENNLREILNHAGISHEIKDMVTVKPNRIE